ncbi:MAG: hypothetical protein IKF19_05260 [Bacilli bacterium]|nr:hypothetical protein [Bacilli bacterium]
MSVLEYKSNIQITRHFNSKEFKCPHCGKMKISTELISKLENLFSKVNASKCIISSGYRCSIYDRKQNGFAGRHSEGVACDCIFYDKNYNPIPSKIICCIAFELGFSGIAYINNNYTHLDIRTNGLYRGDETRGNLNYWSNPYSYFKVNKNDIMKYTGNSVIKYQSHGLNKSWYPNVISGTNDYAGVFGVPIDGIYIDNYEYRVKVNGKWLSPVKGRNDFAGIYGKPITDIAIKGANSYQVHIQNGGWLPLVSGYNINDYKNGYAGNGKIIDAFRIK